MSVKMPEPVAWWNPRKDNASTDPVHKHTEGCLPLITIEQADSYAQAVRDEALEEAAKRAESMHHDSAPYWVALRIRELKMDRS